MSVESQLDLSIVVVNFRTWKHLGPCLESLSYLANHQRLRCEVIVVDNHSGDGELAAFQRRFDWVRFIESPVNGGFAKGCNLGAASANGHCLLFLNPDCLDHQQVIAPVYNEVKDLSQISTVSQRGGNDEARKVGGPFPRWWAAAGPGRALVSLTRRLAGGRYKGAPGNRLEWVSGSFLMMARADFLRLGGWDEDYWMYSEDVDLCRRASQLGIGCQLLDGYQIIHHHGGASRSSSAIKALTRSEVVMSKHRYCQKHFSGVARTMAQLQIRLFQAWPGMLLGWLIPTSGIGQKAFHLRGFYRQVRRTGQWRSPRTSQPPSL